MKQRKYAHYFLFLVLFDFVFWYFGVSFATGGAGRKFKNHKKQKKSCWILCSAWKSHTLPVHTGAVQTVFFSWRCVPKDRKQISITGYRKSQKIHPKCNQIGHWNVAEERSRKKTTRKPAQIQISAEMVPRVLQEGPPMDPKNHRKSILESLGSPHGNHRLPKWCPKSPKI